MPLSSTARAILPGTRTPRTLGGGVYVLVTALLALAVAAAFYAWTVQARSGLGVTGLNADVTWGLYIVNFEFLVGLATGTMLVAAFAYAVPVRPFLPVARLSAVIAFLSLLLAGLSITTSLGRPDRVLYLILYPSVGSPLVWDVAVIATSLVLFGLIVHLAMREDLLRTARDYPRLAWIAKTLALWRTNPTPRSLARDRTALRALAALAIPWSLVLHSTTAWIFGIVKARPAWHSTLLAPLYVASAVVSGVALILLLALFLKWTIKARVPEKGLQSLAVVLAIGVPILGYFLFAEMLTATFEGGVPEESIVFDEMMRGEFAWVFWFDLVAGLLLPTLVFVLPALRRSHVALFAASALVVLGVFAERFNLVVVPQLHKLLPAAAGSYSPTWVEVWLVVGTYAAIGLGVMLVAHLVPLVEEETEAPPAGA